MLEAGHYMQPTPADTHAVGKAQAILERTQPAHAALILLAEDAIDMATTVPVSTVPELSVR